MVFQCINIRQVPWEMLKTAAFGLGFQHLPRDLANVNAWKTMFDPYIKRQDVESTFIRRCFNIVRALGEIILSNIGTIPAQSFPNYRGREFFYCALNALSRETHTKTVLKKRGQI